MNAAALMSTSKVYRAEFRAQTIQIRQIKLLSIEACDVELP